MLKLYSPHPCEFSCADTSTPIALYFAVHLFIALFVVCLFIFPPIPFPPSLIFKIVSKNKFAHSTAIADAISAPSVAHSAALTAALAAHSAALAGAISVAHSAALAAALAAHSAA